MITPELVSYIEKQIKNKTPEEKIRSKLIEVGWHIDDIEEGFLNLHLELEPPTPFLEIKQKESLEIKDKKEEGVKVWTPMSIPVKKENEDVRRKIGISKPIENNKNEELIPTLIPKEIGSNSSVVKEVPVKENELNKTNDQNKAPSTNDSSFTDLPKIAMISSYGKDVLSASQKEEEIIQKKKSKLSKYVLIIMSGIIGIGIIIGIVWAIISGNLNIKNINFSFIKKDPKVLLLNNSKILSNLNSYKTETNIEITSPSFASISTGLISGEAVQVPDKDTISISSKGIINQNNGEILSKDLITIKSSLLSGDIETEIKNDGESLFISVPDLDKVLEDNFYETSLVKLDEAQMGLITSFFDSKTKTKLDKINFYKILSEGIISYMNSDDIIVYDEFINEAEIIEKGEETIKDIDTYHYLVNPDKQSIKKLLNRISNEFTVGLLDDDLKRVDQILGSMTVNSFDVWIGKKDHNIYQYSIDLDVPISKIIGFDDKSIGDNGVNLLWKTTFYDFDIENNINIPEEYTTVEDFIKSVDEKKMRKDIISFKQLATDLLNSENNNKSNPSGNCMNPVSGSLFSPTGHSKTSINKVGLVSELLNKILGVTKGAGFCYSKLKDWSFTVPIADNYDIDSIPTAEYKYYFCIDSKGSVKELITPPKGVVCE